MRRGSLKGSIHKFLAIALTSVTSALFLMHVSTNAYQFNQFQAKVIKSALEASSESLATSLVYNNIYEASKTLENFCTELSLAYCELLSNDYEPLGIFKQKISFKIDQNKVREFQIIHASRLVGRLRYSHEQVSIFSSLSKNIWIFVISMVLLATTLLYSFKRFIEPTLKGLALIAEILKSDLRTSIEKLETFHSPIEEINKISRRFKSSFEETLASVEIQKRSEILREVKKAFRSFHHDSEGQFSAIKAIADESKTLDERERYTIKNAISCILDSILHIKNSMEGTQADSSVRPQLVSSALENIVSEVRYANRKFIDLDIELKLNTQAYGYFAEFDTTTFHRCISNLVYNAIEATSKKGKIEIKLGGSASKIEISVTDNGKGISPGNLDKVRAVVNRESKERFSTKGSGLGLRQVAEAVYKWRGKLKVLSIPDSYTTFSLELKRCSPPKTFLSNILLERSTHVVIIDDDPLIHHIFDQRLKAINFEGEISHFSTASEFEKHMQSKGYSNQPTLYLMDNELIDRERNTNRDQFPSGISLIAKYNLCESAILVTSTYSNPEVIIQSERLGLKVVPKNLARHIPIKIITSKRKSHIFIDDTPFNHLFWKQSADSNNISLQCFFDVNEFILFSSLYHKSSVIYLDSKLGHGVKGEIESQKLYSRGFKNVIIHSGDRLNVDNTPYIKEIIGKSPPFNEKWFQNTYLSSSKELDDNCEVLQKYSDS